MIVVHSVEQIEGSQFSKPDRILVGNLPNVANVAGAAAGDSVVTAVSFPYLPDNYSVSVTPSQAAFVSVSGKTNAGFNVTLTPPASTDTIAAGTFDVTITS